MKKTITIFTTLVLVMLMTCAFPLTVHAATHQGYNTAAVYLNGQPLTLDSPAVLKDGATLVPMKALFKALDPTVTTDWNGQEQSVTAKWGTNSLYLKLNEKQVNLNGNKIDIPVAPQLVGSSTYVPLKVVAESFGAKVEWDGANGRVLITTTTTIPRIEDVKPATPTVNPTSERTKIPGYTEIKPFGMGVETFTSPVIKVNGIRVEFKTIPIVVYDRSVLVSADEILKAFDPRIKITNEGNTYTIRWGSPERTFTFTLNDVEGAKKHYAYVYQDIATPAQMVDGVLMIPIEFIGEAFVADVSRLCDWQMIELNTPKLAATWETLQIADYSKATFTEIMQAVNSYEEACKIFEKAVFDEVNKRREEINVPALIWDDRLQKAARLHSEDQATNKFLGHIGSDGSLANDRVARQGWSGSAVDNVIFVIDSETPWDIVDVWYYSPGHKLVMMQDVKEPYYAGVGMCLNSDGKNPDGTDSMRGYATFQFALKR